jgi:hypothetical protein
MAVAIRGANARSSRGLHGFVHDLVGHLNRVAMSCGSPLLCAVAAEQLWQCLPACPICGGGQKVSGTAAMCPQAMLAIQQASTFTTSGCTHSAHPHVFINTSTSEATALDLSSSTTEARYAVVCAGELLLQSLPGVAVVWAEHLPRSCARCQQCGGQCWCCHASLGL